MYDSPAFMSDFCWESPWTCRLISILIHRSSDLKQRSTCGTAPARDPFPRPASSNQLPLTGSRFDLSLQLLDLVVQHKLELLKLLFFFLIKNALFFIISYRRAPCADMTCMYTSRRRRRRGRRSASTTSKKCVGRVDETTSRPSSGSRHDAASGASLRRGPGRHRDRDTPCIWRKRDSDADDRSVHIYIRTPTRTEFFFVPLDVLLQVLDRTPSGQIRSLREAISSFLVLHVFC